MSHVTHLNAPLTPEGRRKLVDLVIEDGWAQARVAERLQVSRATVSKWVRRYRAQGLAGLADHSSKPHRSPSQTARRTEHRIIALRFTRRWGPHRIGYHLHLPQSTVSKVLKRYHVPLLGHIDLNTGLPVRKPKPVRYERKNPGDLVHVDVKKLGRIPDGGGWRADPDQTARNHRSSHHRVGFDYVHAVIDDHSRLAYAEIHDDEKGTTAAAVLLRAAEFFAHHGIEHIERVISDNAFAYRNSAAFQAAVAQIGAEQRFIKPHCPWTNGKVERLNRTLATEWAYRQIYTSNPERTDALAPWLNHYNTERIHTGIGGTPISRVSPT
ncbi:MAG: IS481 family transposase [Cryobacterium sp.]